LETKLNKSKFKNSKEIITKILDQMEERISGIKVEVEELSLLDSNKKIVIMTTTSKTSGSQSRDQTYESLVQRGIQDTD
jgi:hypothetical protein